MTSYVSLFSGAGGFDLGAQRCGLIPRLVTDISSDCIETIRSRQNYYPRTLISDIRALLASGELRHYNPDLLIGGPPCQGFSVAGKIDPADPRSEMVFRFMDAVGQVRPAAFILENVPSLASPPWSLVMERLLTQAGRLGYDTYALVLDAQEHYVAQARKRLFLFGVPAGSPAVVKPARGMWVNPARVILESPAVHPGKGNIHPKARITLARNPVLRQSPYAGMLLNGGGRVFDLDGPAPTLPATMCGNHTPVYDVNQLRHGDEPWIVGYHRDLLDGEPPLTEVPPHVKMRRLSFREAAGLQDFPGSYPFYGSDTSRWRQVGNAVPPRLGTAAVKALLTAVAI